MGAILSKQTDFKLYHFYRYLDKNYTTIYVGKTLDIITREKQHKRNGYNNINKIISIYCDDLWSKKIEQAFIDFLKPRDNIRRALCCTYEPYMLSPYFKQHLKLYL